MKKKIVSIFLTLILAFTFTLPNVTPVQAEPITIGVIAVNAAKNLGKKLLSNVIKKLFHGGSGGQETTPVDLSQKSLDAIRAIVSEETKKAIDEALIRENYYDLKSKLGEINDKLLRYEALENSNPNDPLLKTFAVEIENLCTTAMNHKVLDKTYNPYFWSLNDTYVMLSAIRISAAKDANIAKDYIDTLAKTTWVPWLTDSKTEFLKHDILFSIRTDYMSLYVKDKYSPSNIKYKGYTFNIGVSNSKTGEFFKNNNFNSIGGNRHATLENFSKVYDRESEELVDIIVTDYNNSCQYQLERLKDSYYNYNNDLIKAYQNIVLE